MGTGSIGVRNGIRTSGVTPAKPIGATTLTGVTGVRLRKRSVRFGLKITITTTRYSLNLRRTPHGGQDDEMTNKKKTLTDEEVNYLADAVGNLLNTLLIAHSIKTSLAVLREYYPSLPDFTYRQLVVLTSTFKVLIDGRYVSGFKLRSSSDRRQEFQSLHEKLQERRW